MCRDDSELVVRANARLREFNQLMSQATHDAATERLTVRERQVLEQSVLLGRYCKAEVGMSKQDRPGPGIDAPEPDASEGVRGQSCRHSCEPTDTDESASVDMPKRNRAAMTIFGGDSHDPTKDDAGRLSLIASVDRLAMLEVDGVAPRQYDVARVRGQRIQKLSVQRVSSPSTPAPSETTTLITIGSSRTRSVICDRRSLITLATKRRLGGQVADMDGEG